MRKIHPTALVDPAAELADGVEVQAHAVIEADVQIGQNCRILHGAIIRRYTVLGAGNVVGHYCVLGGEPQDYKFDPTSKTYLRIGSGNVFREYVTLSRATTEGAATVIGSGCYFMTQSHVGHDSSVGDGAILTNNAAVAGHCQIGPRAILSGNTLVHQFCWLGEQAMMRGTVAISQHVPPFCMVMGNNYVAGLNVVGMRRAEGFTADDRRQVKQAYELLYQSGMTTSAALAEMDKHVEWGGPAGRFRDFVRRVHSAHRPYNRGLCTASATQRAGDVDL